jgi:hypothetical protein
MRAMSGFEAEAEEIRSAGKQMTTAAGEVKAADPSRSMADVASALPGSQSAAAAGALATTWSKRFTSWSDDGVGQGERMAKAAERYDESDHRAATQMRLLLHHTGEMR